jgi:signal transduction histidine kinase
VEISYTAAFLAISIIDDGKGIDLTPLNDANGSSFGLGIRNMHSRAKLIGASFKMNSTLGKGTRVNINLPIETVNHDSNG